MRLPATLTELCAQLQALPTPVRSVTVPTEHGPFVLEFETTAPRAPQQPEKKPEPVAPAIKKVSDLELLRKQTRNPPPPFVEDPASATG